MMTDEPGSAWLQNIGDHVVLMEIRHDDAVPVFLWKLIG